MPVETSSGDAAGSTWRNEVSAPSNCTSTQAKASAAGAWPAGGATHDHEVTVPSGPTSTMPDVSSPVSGSYSVGRHDDPPPAPPGADDLAVAQPGQEGAHDRAQGAHEGVLEDVVGRVDHRVVCHVTSPVSRARPGRDPGLGRGRN